MSVMAACRPSTSSKAPAKQHRPQASRTTLARRRTTASSSPTGPPAKGRTRTSSPASGIFPSARRPRARCGCCSAARATTGRPFRRRRRPPSLTTAPRRRSSPRPTAPPTAPSSTCSTWSSGTARSMLLWATPRARPSRRPCCSTSSGSSGAGAPSRCSSMASSLRGGRLWIPRRMISCCRMRATRGSRRGRCISVSFFS